MLRERTRCGVFCAGGRAEKDAEELVDTVDRERADFIQKYFNVRWPDRPGVSRLDQYGDRR